MTTGKDFWKMCCADAVMMYACMIRCMKMDKAREECKDRSRWRSLVSTYGKKA